MKQLLPILFIAALCFSKTNNAAAQVNTGDSLALVDLYKSTDGSHWFNNSGWLKGPVSSWYGVSLENARISGVDLQYNQISGKLPASLANITNLKYLLLGHNHLTGRLPSGFKNLTGLTILGVEYNQLSGQVPSLANAVNLSDLFLANNQFTGAIPDFHNSNPHGEIDLGHNLFSGTIPDWLGNMTNVGVLSLANNQLSGPVPASIGSLNQNTGIIDLSFNKLSGTLPSSLLNLAIFPYPIVSLQNNFLSFDGLEYIISVQPNLNFTYAPQLNIPITYTPSGDYGKLSVHAGGTLSNNTYQWFRNNSLYKTISGDSTFTPDAAGVYFVRVNNSVVTGLPLVSDSITVVQACAAAPVNDTVINIQQTAARLTWSASQGAIKYQVKYKAAGTTTFTTVNTKNTSVYITGLSAGTAYQWKVRARCSLRYSDFTPLKLFVTVPGFATTNMDVSELRAAKDFAVYPNPAKSVVNLVINSAKQSSYTVTIFDLQGKSVIKKAGITNVGNTNISLDIHALTRGTYIIKIQYGDKSAVSKLLKE